MLKGLPQSARGTNWHKQLEHKRKKRAFHVAEMRNWKAFFYSEAGAEMMYRTARNREKKIFVTRWGRFKQYLKELFNKPQNVNA
ncbi:MAG: hypothetical protein AAB588_05800 [Patescibacteria group bacterium]